MCPNPENRIAALLVSLLLAAMLPGCGGERRPNGSPPAGGARPPSILLISIDTMRADHLGCAGYSPYDEPVSPEIDRFAKESARFTQCFAPRAQTMPSLTSMLTGRFPSSHGVLENAQPLDASVATLAETLNRQGYETAAFLSFLPTVPDGNPARGSKTIGSGRDSGLGGAAPAAQWQWDAGAAFQAIEWLASRKPGDAAPFFAWVHFYDVHQPYVPQPPLDRAFIGDYAGKLLLREGAHESDFAPVEHALDEAALSGTPLSPADHAYAVALYDAGIRGVDRHVGAILRALDERGLSRETIVIVTADHGEELAEHNAYYFHGNSVYDGALRIPLIVRWPGRITPGITLDAIVQNVDFVPTILEWAGAPAPPEIEGISFASLLGYAAPTSADRSATVAARTAAFGEWQDLIVSVRTPAWKLISNPRGAHPKKPPFFDKDRGGFRVRCEELYRVDADPAEARDVSAESAVVADSLRAVALAHRHRAGGGRTMVATAEDAVTEELRALGYVGAPADRSDVILGAEPCGDR